MKFYLEKQGELINFNFYWDAIQKNNYYFNLGKYAGFLHG